MIDNQLLITKSAIVMNLLTKFKIPIITILVTTIVIASMIVNLIYLLRHLELL